ncbi:MAG: HEAT repeat domain-containing protein [Chlamydiae bacterium]|nr:HEAT repeat domain-containing protein [Chlamydiota bacterium]
MKWLSRLILFWSVIYFPGVVLASELEDDLVQLHDPSEDVRYEAVVALGELADPASAPDLEALIHDPAMSVRHAAAEALAEMGDQRTEEFFNQLVLSSSVEQRRLGAVGLGLLGCGESSFKVLMDLTQDENWEVRWAAVFSLGKLADPRAKPILEKAAQGDERSDVRRAAQESLEKLESRIRWYHDLAEVLNMAAVQPDATHSSIEKNLLVIFQIPSALACRALLDQVLTQPEMIEEAKNFISVKLNPKAVSEISEKYFVQGVPTVLFLNSKGEILDRLDGLTDFETLLNKMKEYDKPEPKKGEDPLFQKWVLINQYLDNESFDEAIRLLEGLLEEGRKTPQLMLYLGYSYGKVKAYLKSKDILKELLAQYPDFENKDKALYCLSLSELALGKVDEAKKVLEDLKRQFPSRSSGEWASKILSQIQEREKK